MALTQEHALLIYERIQCLFCLHKLLNLKIKKIKKEGRNEPKQGGRLFHVDLN